MLHQVRYFLKARWRKKCDICFFPAVAPEVISEAEGLLLTTVRRTNELIDNLPPTGQTGAEMAALWGAAYPQLRTLLEKSAAWAAQVPVPA